MPAAVTMGPAPQPPSNVVVGADHDLTETATRRSCQRRRCRADEIASEEQRRQEQVAQAKTLLQEDSWAWLRELLIEERDMIGDALKCFFVRLHQASTSAEMDAILGDMESWREDIAPEDQLDREERQSIQSLFLLAVDKHMSLARSP